MRKRSRVTAKKKSLEEQEESKQEESNPEKHEGRKEAQKRRVRKRKTRSYVGARETGAELGEQRREGGRCKKWSYR